MENLAPYMVLCCDGEIWLENMATGRQFFRGVKTPALKAALIKKLPTLNSAVGLSRLGV